MPTVAYLNEPSPLFYEIDSNIVRFHRTNLSVWRYRHWRLDQINRVDRPGAPAEFRCYLMHEAGAFLFSRFPTLEAANQWLAQMHSD